MRGGMEERERGRKGGASWREEKDGSLSLGPISLEYACSLHYYFPTRQSSILADNASLSLSLLDTTSDGYLYPARTFISPLRRYFPSSESSENVTFDPPGNFYLINLLFPHRRDRSLGFILSFHRLMLLISQYNNIAAKSGAAVTNWRSARNPAWIIFQIS